MAEAEPPAPHKSDPTAARPATGLTAGRTLGDFQILRKLGEGGMGQVYLARQLSLKREVALKLLRNDLNANPTALKRFEAEAQAVARLNHPNIVQVYHARRDRRAAVHGPGVRRRPQPPRLPRPARGRPTCRSR